MVSLMSNYSDLETPALCIIQYVALQEYSDDCSCFTAQLQVDSLYNSLG